MRAGTRLLPAWLALLCACGPGPDAVVVGSKPFTESQLAGELVAQLLESQGVKVKRRFYMGGAVCFTALKAGDLDVYVEYTGTGLMNILGEPSVPDPRKVFERVRSEFDRRWGLAWLPPLGFNNTYALVMRRQDAAERGIARISDLRKLSPKPACGFDLEFSDRPDGYPGLSKRYGFAFCGPVSQMNPDLMYSALASGQVDLISGYSTDGRIERLDLVVLEDDRAFFPPYEAAPLVSRKALAKDPKLIERLSRLAGRISDAEITRLNAEVEGGKRPAHEVAREFLARKGLVE